MGESLPKPVGDNSEQIQVLSSEDIIKEIKKVRLGIAYDLNLHELNYPNERMRIGEIIIDSTESA